MLYKILSQLIGQTIYAFQGGTSILYQGQLRSIDDGIVTLEFHDNDGSSLGFVAFELASIENIQYGHPNHQKADRQIKAYQIAKTEIEKAFSKGE